MKGPVTQNENAPGLAGVFATANTTPTFSFPKPSTVKGRVLNDLLAGCEITHKDTWSEHGSSRLAHHVYCLRRDGWLIDVVERELLTTDGGCSAPIGFYSLPNDNIDIAGERGQCFIAAARSAKGGQ